MSKISRRTFNKEIALSAASIALGTGMRPPLSIHREKILQQDNRKIRRPNFVFISSDQHSFRYAGFMGHSLVKTPNLDKLASAGIVLENNYCGSPVCVPSRASMMTGMFPSDVNSFCNSTVYDGSYPTWGKRLREAGYYCWGTGKADLNDAVDLGFKGTLSNGHSKNPDITSLFRRPTIFRINERDQINGEFRSERSKDAKIANIAVDFIKDKSVKINKPWMAYVGFHLPHPSFVGLKPYYDYYLPRVKLPYIPDGYLEKLPLSYQVLRHFKCIATPIPAERRIRATAAYFAMISELDEYIGNIYNALEESGQLDNTYFIYTSDHGEALGYNGLWLKNNLYEGAAHVPLVFSGPNLPQGKRIKEPTGHVDLIATMMEWAGLKNTKVLRGKSLTPLITGKEDGSTRFAYTESHSEGNPAGSCMIRMGDWKLMDFTWYGECLFNLKEDPNEINNLIDDPRYKDVTDKLRYQLHQLVDTEAITLRAFEFQNKVLRGFVDSLSEEGLAHLFKRRLGVGQSVSIAKKLKSRMLS